MFGRKRETHRHALRDELQAMCNARQMELLELPARLRRDVGFDCGCDPLPRRAVLAPPFR